MSHWVCSKRASSKSELKLLEKHAFIATSNTTAIIMVEVDKLAGVLEAFKEAKLAATIAFLRGMPSVDGSSSSQQVDPLFPDCIPTCTISSEQLEGPYSIPSIAPSLCRPATKWGKQLVALGQWKTSPPLNSHDRVKKVGETSIMLMVRSLEEYMGFCYKHLDLEPSMDLVMQCNTFSQFMAFKLARGNESSTMLRGAQQISLTIAFVMSGHCRPLAMQHSASSGTAISRLTTGGRWQRHTTRVDSPSQAPTYPLLPRMCCPLASPSALPQT